MDEETEYALGAAMDALRVLALTQIYRMVLRDQPELEQLLRLRLRQGRLERWEPATAEPGTPPRWEWQQVYPDND